MALESVATSPQEPSLRTLKQCESLQIIAHATTATFHEITFAKKVPVKNFPAMPSSSPHNSYQKSHTYVLRRQLSTAAAALPLLISYIWVMV